MLFIVFFFKQKTAYEMRIRYWSSDVCSSDLGADILFIESAFAREDAMRGADRAHLTTEQASRIARLAGAKRVEPFHFSARYVGAGDRPIGRAGFRARVCQSV